ncbi:MAG: HAD hydrolase family protein [Candidatus Eremiobacteraeota bacterium]|nr:HAD hydrolase family protein [Candidatus Eremiobacteraeota bacterium]
MRYLALVTDYDGTLARGGDVEAATLQALAALRQSNRFLIMVTGRILDDLASIFKKIDLFDAIVAENGAVLYEPAQKKRAVLAPPPPPELAQLLQARGVPLEGVGDVIVATREPHEKTVLDTIRELGLEMQLIFNKGAVMVLPSGVNKASGLDAALKVLKLSAHNAVGVGDAENDHAFLTLCECSAATGNALDSVKAHADIVLEKPNGQGVTSLATSILENDLADVSLEHRRVSFGTASDGAEILIDPYLRGTMLFAGASGHGKSTAASGFVERLMQRGYQVCVVDPEGDYDTLGDAIVLGDAKTIPTLAEVGDVLDNPERSAIVNLLGVQMHDRPAYVDELLPHLFSCRARFGRPHWIVLDEAHHLFPSQRDPDAILPRELYGLLAITTEPNHLAPALLTTVQTVVAVGDDAAATIEKATGATLNDKVSKPSDSHVLLWQAHAPHEAVLAEPWPPQSKKTRHRRKYAEGDLAPEKSFFFQGPDGKLNLRANNLTIFAQIAEGIDDETWSHHLRRGDYAKWFEQAIGDDELAQAAHRAQREPQTSRERILAAIREKYTGPA